MALRSKIFKRADYFEIYGDTIKNKILNFAGNFTECRTKARGYERGFIFLGNAIYYDDRLSDSVQIATIIHELAHYILFAIIENMQREDLNPIEEAEGLRQMTDTFGMTQEQVSKSVGKSRPYITNCMRLLKLPEYVKDSIADGRLSAGHGRTLITLKNEDERKTLWERIINEGLSVREAEKLAAQEDKPKKRKPATKRKDPNVTRVEEELKAFLETKVTINNTGNKGKIEIEYYSKDELERLIELLKSLA